MEHVRVALITGGTRGIGAAITFALAADGMNVAAGFSRNQDAADQVAAAMAAEGHTVSVHQGNVGNPEDCERVVEEVLERYGHIDYLVNNAGITADKTVRKMTIEDWHEVLRINLSGAFYMTKAVLEHMMDRGFGRIVNISSIVGESGGIGQANYAASKSGLFGLTKSLALETARKGITVNCVAPGFIDTDMVSAIPKEALDRVISNIPMGRLGRPHEIAHAVRFLLQDDAAFITGTVLSVNGGMEM
ncbi:MAG: 3-oxoacyl-[acyl-carrier-protein] reductase [Actinomycetota bacterium]|nr:3-oxoacyl-[acyl-carrier-protein] reductase [Actinomycetota bacterium]